MTRFFTQQKIDEATKTYTFQGEDSKYLSQVLRSQVGENLVLCDGDQKDFVLQITSITKSMVECLVLHIVPNTSELPVDITLFQALTKGDKMDFIIQKAVELGVNCVQPFFSTRCIAKIEQKDFAKKQQRWQKIALSGASQSGRGKVPAIGDLSSFSSTISQAVKAYDFIFLAYEGEKNTCLDTIYPEIEKKYQTAQKQNSLLKIGFFIGPEGGFSPEEIKLSQAYSVFPISLGCRILRTETASLFVLSILNYWFDKKISSSQTYPEGERNHEI